MTVGRAGHVAVLLPNGKVLLAGGQFNPGSAELFDPAKLAFSATGQMTNQARGGSQAALLSNGQALITGGVNSFANNAPTASAELYNPATGTFAVTDAMNVQRFAFTATPLLNGTVLIAGGCTNPNCFSTTTAQIYTPTTVGLITSQSGVTFRVAQGNGTLATQLVEVLSNSSTIPWTVSVHTYDGGNWLSAAPSAGNSVPGAAPVNLILSVNPAGLAARDYYAAVTLTPSDGIHPPVSISVVLNIVPAGASVPPVVAPSGLLFVGAAGATLNPQNFNVTNLTSSPAMFTATGSTAPKFFSVTPATGTIPPASTATFTVTPNITGLAPGVYHGSVNLSFGGGGAQSVSLLLVVSAGPGATANHAQPRAASACTPGQLLPVFTTLGIGFSTPAAWPASIGMKVVDDCGNQIDSGSVIVSFSNGDPAVGLLSTGNGVWAGTWVPQNNFTGVTVRADARALTLTGSVEITGQVSSNPSAPVVFKGGVVSVADFASPPALGLIVSIFGSGLADSTVSGSLPLLTQLGTTQVVLGGETLPLFYVSDGLINVLVPYDLPVNAATQLVVQRANAISVPVPTAVFDASPSILSANGTGSGQGHVYVIGAGGIETLANQDAPAKAGDPLVIYCTGLGAVSPAVTGGSIAPSAPPAMASAQVTVTFGNQTVRAGFAGLTPGLSGLYQVNTSVPSGVTAGDQVPVTISAGGKSSSSSIFMTIH